MQGSFELGTLSEEAGDLNEDTKSCDAVNLTGSSFKSYN